MYSNNVPVETSTSSRVISTIKLILLINDHSVSTSEKNSHEEFDSRASDLLLLLIISLPSPLNIYYYPQRINLTNKGVTRVPMGTRG